MGAVWRARCLALDIDVAVKVVRKDAEREDTRGRLIREARAASSLGHPSIVKVLDFGVTAEGEPYLVLELLEGRSLSELLDLRGRFSAEDAVALMLPLANALAMAHARGVIHRDIKPDNVIVTSTEGGALVPKLIDFGIAKLDRNDYDTTTTLTEQGMVMGSPGYMSPEQAEGVVDIDAQSDQWSFCVVLYELMTGRPPFDGPTVRAVIFSIFANDPVPTTRLAAGDDDLWRIVERGLAKNPADRWPSMMHLGRALASWAMQHGVTTDVTGASLASWQEDELVSSPTMAVAREPRSERPRRRRTPAPPPPKVPSFDLGPSSIDVARQEGAAAPAESRLAGHAALCGFAIAFVLGAVAAFGHRAPQRAELVSSTVLAAQPAQPSEKIARAELAPLPTAVPPSGQMDAPVVGATAASATALPPRPPRAATRGSSLKRLPIAAQPDF